jgi:hypothetical protein
VIGPFATAATRAELACSGDVGPLSAGLTNRRRTATRSS